MKLFYRLQQLFSVACMVFLVNGCVAVDSRAWKEPVDKNSLQAISGRFQNYSSYRSQEMGFQGSQYFTQLIDINRNIETDTFSLLYAPSNGLTIELYEGAKKVTTKTYSQSDGLKVNDEGKIELFSNSGCGGRDSPGFGCMSKTVTLFINPEGDLVSVQSGGGAGVLGILPFGVYGKLVAIFPREK